MWFNVLGEWLVQMGKFDDGEFDFDQVLLVGGVEDISGVVYMLLQNLESSISQLVIQFDGQQVQFIVLQSLLMDVCIEFNFKFIGMLVQGYIFFYFGGCLDLFSGYVVWYIGIDIVILLGMLVYVVVEGMVIFVGICSGYGDVIEIDYGNGYMMCYVYNSKLIVYFGQCVWVGDVIVDVGFIGCFIGLYVYFEVWYKGCVVNLLVYVCNYC